MSSSEGACIFMVFVSIRECVFVVPTYKPNVRGNSYTNVTLELTPAVGHVGVCDVPRGVALALSAHNTVEVALVVVVVSYVAFQTYRTQPEHRLCLKKPSPDSTQQTICQSVTGVVLTNLNNHNDPDRLLCLQQHAA